MKTAAMQMLETLHLMENVHGEGHTVRTWHGVESQPPYIIQVCSRGRLLTRFYAGIIPLCVRMVSHWFCSRGFTQVSHGFTLFYMVLRGYRIDITQVFAHVGFTLFYNGFAHAGFTQRYVRMALHWFCSQRFSTVLPAFTRCFLQVLRWFYAVCFDRMVVTRF